MKHVNLRNRTKQFALEVIKSCERLPNEDTSRTLRRQLLRAGTSVGANYRAACRARSKPDFVSKMGSFLKRLMNPRFGLNCPSILARRHHPIRMLSFARQTDLSRSA